MGQPAKKKTKKEEPDVEAAALVLAHSDELAGLDLGEIGDFDGLGDTDASDIKIGAYTWNISGMKGEQRVSPDQFFHTTDETVVDELDLVLLYLKKTHLWAEFDEAAGKSIIHCRSFDRLHGEPKEGGERACKGCPHIAWRSDSENPTKQTRDCSEVFNVYAFDRSTGQPCVIRFKRTSIKALRQYLQKHHLKRRVIRRDGKTVRANYPLFVFGCRMSLRLDKNGKFATPILERGEVLPEDQIHYLADAAKVCEKHVKALRGIEDQEVEDEKVDADFPPDGFHDTGAGSAANRF